DVGNGLERDADLGVAFELDGAADLEVTLAAAEGVFSVAAGHRHGGEGADEQGRGEQVELVGLGGDRLLRGHAKLSLSSAEVPRVSTSKDARPRWRGVLRRGDPRRWSPRTLAIWC